MKTIADFAEACKTLESDEIYNLFEFDIRDELRSEIISQAAHDAEEPVRSALENIGLQYSVQSLIDY
jgi:hypothetical protein